MPPPRLLGHDCVSHRAGGTYHAELRLQLDLQTLEGAPQVGDLRLAHLQLLGVASDLPVQLLRLKQKKRQGELAEVDLHLGASSPLSLAFPKGRLLPASYPAGEPGFRILPVLLSHDFILAPHVAQDLG